MEAGARARDMTPWHYQPPWDPYAYRRKQWEQWQETIRSWGKRLGALFSVSLFTYLSLAILILLMMTPEISENLFESSDTLFIITPSVTPILEISGATLVLYYLFLAGTIVISYLFLVGKSFLKIIAEIRYAKPGKHSPILTVGGLFFAVLTIEYLYYFIIEASGVSPNVPSIGEYPYWWQIYIYAQASVWEEIISRVLLIGVPLLWMDLLLRRDKLQRPRNYFLGGTFNFGPIEIGLIVFSAVMFGLAHAGGWDLWKVPPTLVAGLALGYLFMRIGLYAAVVFHFAFDFLTIPIANAGLASQAFLGLMILGWLSIGVMFIVYYIMQLKQFLLPKRRYQETAGYQIGP